MTILVLCLLPVAGIGVLVQRQSHSTGRYPIRLSVQPSPPVVTAVDSNDALLPSKKMTVAEFRAEVESLRTVNQVSLRFGWTDLTTAGGSGDGAEERKWSYPCKDGFVDVFFDGAGNLRYTEGRTDP